MRTEYCEGPISDLAPDDVALQTGREDTLGNNGEALCSDRAELIERIKRGESPTWIPNQAVSSVSSSLWDTHSGSLGLVGIYFAINLASQRLKDDLIVSLRLLERCSMVNGAMIHMYSMPFLQALLCLE